MAFRKLKEFMEAFVSRLALLVSRVLLGKNLFEEEYRNQHLKEDSVNLQETGKKDESSPKDKEKDQSEHKKTIFLEDVLKMETFADKIVNQDINYAEELRSGLSEFITQPVSISFHQTDAVLHLGEMQISIGGDSNIELKFDQDGLLVEKGFDVKDIEQCEEAEKILKYIQDFNFENKIALLPETNKLAEALFEEAQYNIIVNQDESNLFYYQNQISVKCHPVEDDVQISCNGEVFYEGRLGDITKDAEQIYQKINACIYENLGYELETHEIEQDPMEFEENEKEYDYEKERALEEEDILLEQMQDLEEAQRAEELQREYEQRYYEEEFEL